MGQCIPHMKATGDNNVRIKSSTWMAQTHCYRTSGTVHLGLNYTPKFIVWEYIIKKKVQEGILKNKEKCHILRL
jgi:hypothetical protein